MDDTPDPDVIAAQVAETRRRHERSIAAIGLLMAAVTVGIAIWRASTFDMGGTTHMAGAGLCLGLMYGVVLVATRKDPLPHAAQWVLSTVEVFAVSAVVYFGKEVSPGYAMTSVAWWGFPLAIGLSGLRLRVALPVYVAALSSIAAVALHALAGGDAAAPIHRGRQGEAAGRHGPAPAAPHPGAQPAAAGRGLDTRRVIPGGAGAARHRSATPAH